MNEANKSNNACAVHEKFWHILLSQIEERSVIPVLGRELITVLIKGEEMSLHRAVAEALLNKYGLGGSKDRILRPRQELNDAVYYLTRQERILDTPLDVYDDIKTLLEEITQSVSPAATEMLHNLADISNFELFITTSFDDLLINALGKDATERILYSPNLSKDRQGDLPEIRPSNYRAVFYLFGRASAFPNYAIHDEDTLEFMYNLMGEHGVFPKRMITEAHNRSLLYVGCNFAHWLNRFFIRLANSKRLAESRESMEFIVGQDIETDESLILFLKRFSSNSRLWSCDARTFLRELAHRWKERHPPGAEVSEEDNTPVTGEIFLSYSRTDIAAAKTLYEELQKMSEGVIWFDKTQIESGDKFNRKISDAINRCKLFLPIISSTTESRQEGYFRKEWDKAQERDRGIQGRKFIIPVVVDKDWDGNVKQYKLLPERFGEYDFSYAPAGHMSDRFKETFTRDLRNIRRGEAS